jgi:hypothetical protein
MENLIYIIVGVAWVAYSLYTTRQKAIQKQQSAGMPPSGPSQSSPLPIPGNQGGGKTLFEDIFRELTGESRPVPQSAPAVAPVSSAKPQMVAPTNDTTISSKGYQFISDVPPDLSWKESENTGISTVNHEQKSKDESITKNFNLREAVIFSELLNRKYF